MQTIFIIENVNDKFAQHCVICGFYKFDYSPPVFREGKREPRFYKKGGKRCW